MSKCDDCMYYTNGEETYCGYDWSKDIKCIDYNKFKPKEPVPVRIWQDGIFTLTNAKHYYVLMADHKYNDEYQAEYSGMHHATIESARMELAQARSDDWGRFIKSLEIKEIGC